MKQRLKKILNNHYYKYLAKPKYRNLLNNFLFFFLWKVFFRIFSLKKVDSKLILFVASNDFTMPPEYESLYKLAKEKGYKPVCIYKSRNYSNTIYKNELRKIKNDLRFIKYYAQAKATFLYDYYLPAYANKPRKNTKLIQIWHACGAFKKWGYSTRKSEWGLDDKFFEKYNVHKTYTHITTSAEKINGVYAEAFSNDVSKVHAVGVPRTDIFFDEKFLSSQKAKLLEKYPELRNKKIILWAPTYRGNDIRSSQNDMAIDFKRLYDIIGDEYALLVKLHPHIAKSMKDEDIPEELTSFVYNISKQFDISSALCFSDMVISDYSSLIFEYALFERPMIFFAYDLEEYDSDRSFYYDYESFVPGEIVKDTEALAKAIINADKNFDREKVVKFRQDFMSACDGKSTERVLELVEE